ncbi:hypothetical protein BG004_004116 [Podila humilis]|nr:hypothetical protein BG004_004116 [Podila humilis]
MDRWDPIQLTSTFRPHLDEYETIQITQDQVGLYDGRLKAEDYNNGTVYLTTDRLLYIDAKNPARKSIGLPLRLISGIHSYLNTADSCLRLQNSLWICIHEEA